MSKQLLVAIVGVATFLLPTTEFQEMVSDKYDKAGFYDFGIFEDGKVLLGLAVAIRTLPRPGSYDDSEHSECRYMSDLYRQSRKSSRTPHTFGIVRYFGDLPAQDLRKHIGRWPHDDVNTRRFVRSNGLDIDEVAMLPMDVGRLVVRGAWGHFHVVPVFQRHRGNHFHMPTRPSNARLRRWRATFRDDLGERTLARDMRLHDKLSQFDPALRHKCLVHSAETLMRLIIATRGLMDQRALRGCGENHVEAMFPERHAVLLGPLEQEGFRWPSR
eukprot:4660914-Pyramimonas_sp.AAC.1